jgi:hypothetical protein
VEAIDLTEVDHEVRRRWQRGQPGDVGYAVIAYGQTAAGLWFVAQYERRGTMAWLAMDEGHAGDVIQRWINRRGGMGKWREIRSTRTEAAT